MAHQSKYQQMRKGWFDQQRDQLFQLRAIHAKCHAMVGLNFFECFDCHLHLHIGSEHTGLVLHGSTGSATFIRDLSDKRVQVKS